MISVIEEYKGEVQNLDSEEIKLARKTAVMLTNYFSKPENGSALTALEAYFSDVYEIWFTVPPITSKIREKVWQRFSLFTSSDDYNSIWNGVFRVIGAQQPSSTLAFYTSFHLFIRLWEHKFPIKIQNESRMTTPCDLTYDERNAIWYVGGYVLRKIQMEMNSEDNAKEILEGLMDGDETGENEDSDNATLEMSHEQWLASINRGGLTKCSNDFYEYLLTVEQRMQKLLFEMETNSSLGNPKEQIEIITSDELVQQSWIHALRREPMSTQHQLETLIQTKVISLYLKIRAFAFTKKKIEQYKIDKQEGLQKTKGLRKQILIHFQSPPEHS